MTNVFFDLDGTIINSQVRIYNLFCELCPENSFSYEEYWEIKRSRLNQKDFLIKYFNYSAEKTAEFKKNWLKKIEEEERLKSDLLTDDIRKLLEKLYLKYNLYVVTNRQSKNLTLKQLKELNIDKYFKKIFITEQKTTKINLIDIHLNNNDIFIGDTGEDIQIAKELGIKSIAISWGTLNREILEEYVPNIIVDEVSELEDYLL